MPSGKRETERKGYAPTNIGSSPNSDGRANNLVEETDEPARGSGPLHYKKRCSVAQHQSNVCEAHLQYEVSYGQHSPPTAFRQLQH
ncbi:hypothetical protein T4A_7667 [Trichinella pseudospiralis]|uniref:Uncharacterized protein n=1 Tax=Trichinella pseudospiralis TaxID=6337 RepID=A0A0V1DTN0_TRIPS|nr:hypothetical protein T4A_2480 [Trichinella pseudospiralis]KRY73711.1 hypothetical protein T4A_7667 [Trichinella pseudospiralis]